MSKARDELPDGWTRATLPEVADVVMGQSPPGSSYNTRGDGLPFFQGKAEFGEDNPTPTRWCSAPSRIARPGDILMSIRAPVGPTNIAREECAIGRGLAAIRPRDGVPASLIRHALALQEEEIASLGTGTTFTAINKNDLGRISLPLPPERERQAVAAALDGATRVSRQLTRTIDTALHRLEILRRGLLASAYSEAMAAAGGLDPLGQLLREPLKNGYSARPVPSPTSFRVLTLTATTTGVFDSRHFKYTDEVFPADSPYWLEPGDVLIQRGNTAERVGVPAVYDGSSRAFLYPDLMIRVRVLPEIDPRFVWYMLSAPEARDFLRDRATGSAGNMPKVNHDSVKAVPIPLPDHETRTAIVERLDSAMSALSDADARLSTSRDRVVALPQAFRAKAFRGELVPNQSSGAR